MISLLNTVLAISLIISILFYLACAWLTYRFFSAAPPSGDRPDGREPVSILVPLCGLDAGARENWLSLCTQDYPVYEVLFGIVSPDDPAIPVARELADTYPDRVHLFTDLVPRGANYKDSSLGYLLEKAKYDTIIFADSDIRVHPGYIDRVTAPLNDKRVGMVTCTFIGYEPVSIGAAIASFGRCFDFIPSLLIARTIDRGLRCAVGATIATRRATLAEYGGLLFNRIGSDYNIGKRAAEAGYRVELSSYVLDARTGAESIGEVFRREIRWARTIRFNRGPQYYTILFCYGTIFCPPLLFVSGFAPWAIALVAVAIALRLAQIAVCIYYLKAFGLLKWLWVLPLREMLNPVIWAIGAFGRRVFWRGRWLRVEGDGLISPWEPL